MDLGDCSDTDTAGLHVSAIGSMDLGDSDCTQTGMDLGDDLIVATPPKKKKETSD